MASGRSEADRHTPGGVGQAELRRPAVRLAHEEQLVVSVRGGGRSVAGFSTCNDGIVIDLSQMGGVTIDPVRRRATARGGALIERQGRSAYYLDGRLRRIPMDPDALTKRGVPGPRRVGEARSSRAGAQLIFDTWRQSVSSAVLAAIEPPPLRTEGSRDEFPRHHRSQLLIPVAYDPDGRLRP